MSSETFKIPISIQEFQEQFKKEYLINPIIIFYHLIKRLTLSLKYVF